MKRILFSKRQVGQTRLETITDNFSEKPKMIRGKEKIGRFINYYNDTGKFIKMQRIWGTYDEMQNISPTVAKDYFNLVEEK